MEEIIKNLMEIIELAYFKMLDSGIVTTDEYRVVTKELKELKKRLDKITVFQSEG